MPTRLVVSLEDRCPPSHRDMAAPPIADGALPPPLPALRFAALDAGLAPLERLRSDNEEALRRALDALDALDVSLVLTHRLTTLLTHVFPHGLASLGRVAECVELTDELAKVHGRSVVYAALPQVEDVRSIATHAGLLRSVQPTERKFALLVAGKWTLMCADALVHHGLAEIFQVEEVPLGFIALDSDLLTLGRERCLYDCFVDGNKSVLADTARALMQLQRLYGPFSEIKYKGSLSGFVFQQLMELESCEGTGVEPSKKSRKGKSCGLHTLVLLDRSLDFPSALSTPLTLEALVGDLFDGKDGFATIPQSSSAIAQVLPLNGCDPTFARVRGQNIHAVSATLNAEAIAVKSAFDRFRTTSATASAAEVHEFVKTVPQMKAKQESLERLVALVEATEALVGSRAFREQWQLERTIMDEDVDAIEVFRSIEDAIFRNVPMLDALRMLCMFSVVHDGIPREILARLKMRLLRTYGHELIFTFENLERLGLLRERGCEQSTESVIPHYLGGGSRVSTFFEVAKTLKAIDVDVDPLNPGSMAFVTSGYAPLLCLLIEHVLKHSSWEAIDPLMQRLDGPRAEIKVRSTARDEKAEKETAREKAKHTEKRRVLVVCVVGGVTYAEAAALRWLSQFYPSHEILIASTSIVNCRSFLHELLERIPSTT